MKKAMIQKVSLKYLNKINFKTTTAGYLPFYLIKNLLSNGLYILFLNDGELANY